MRYEDIEYYAVEYRKGTSGAWLYSPTPPASGSLAVDNFSVPNLTGLDYDSTYQYRAYMVVDYISYYGTTRTAVIAAEPYAEYDVITDITATVSAYPDGTGFNTDNNTFGGTAVPTNITKYGIVYTQSAAQGTEANLNIDNVNVMITDSTLPASSPFIAAGTGLSPNTRTYYRAFVENGTGATDPSRLVAYGLIEEVVTATPPPTIFTVYIDMEWTDPNIEGGDGFAGVVSFYSGQTFNPESLVDQFDMGIDITHGESFLFEGNVGTDYSIDFSGVDAYLDSHDTPYMMEWQEKDSGTVWQNEYDVHDITVDDNNDLSVKVYVESDGGIPIEDAPYDVITDATADNSGYSDGTGFDTNNNEFIADSGEPRRFVSFGFNFYG